MIRWHFDGRRAIADCGPYTGPWPPSAPSWLTLGAFIGALFDVEPYAAARVEIAYVTAQIPADWGDLGINGPGEIATNAWIGSDSQYDYRTSRYGFPTPWDYPSFWWDYWDEPDFSLDMPPRTDGIHLFVVIDWPYMSDYRFMPRLVRSVDPLLLVPIGYVDNAHGPMPWPGVYNPGSWSPWKPRRDRALVISNFYSSPGRIDSAVFWTTTSYAASDTTPEAAMAAARALLQAGIPADTADATGVYPNYNQVIQGVDGYGSWTARLTAWQYADAFSVDESYQLTRIDLQNIRPAELQDVLGTDADSPKFYGQFDPHTVGGFGWQWEDPDVGNFQGLIDSGTLSAFGFVWYTSPGGLIPVSTPRPASCPFRIYAREYTGPVSSWMPLDGDAVLLGDFTVDQSGWWSGPTTSSTFRTGTLFGRRGDLRVPYHRIPWRDFWIIVVPAYAFPDGEPPEVPQWLRDLTLVPGDPYAEEHNFNDSPYGNYFFYGDQHFAVCDIDGRYTMPRWRYWKPSANPLLNLPPAAAEAGDRDVVFRQPSISRA